MYGEHFEGDIILTKEQKNQLKLRSFTEFDIKLWDNGIVPYTFAPGHFSKYIFKFKVILKIINFVIS
jgi:hypothetical protein